MTDGGGATPELAYSAAREIFDRENENMLLGNLRVHRLDDERWRVLRRQEQGGDVVETEADIFYPQRFRTAQTLATYLFGIAQSDRDEWPFFVPEVSPTP